MSAVRLAGIPIDHLIAEVVAFPLTSEAALRLAVVELDPELPSPMRKLWRLTECHVLSSFPALSVDEVVALRDKIWFGERATGPISLATYLQRQARSFLALRGSQAVPKLPDDADNAPGRGPEAPLARWAWRWISFALPPDLLLAALAPDPVRIPDEIDVLSPLVAQCLRDHHYAETHCHVGAGLDFSLLWVSVLRALGDTRTGARAFESCGACLNEGRELADWLLLAALTRVILAAYLAHGTQQAGLTGFLPIVLNWLTRQAPVSDGALLLWGLEELASGGFTNNRPPFAHWQALYRRLSQVTLRRLADLPGEAQGADPIAGWFPPLRGGRVTPEMRFVAEGLAYVTAQRDLDFARLFWQILRIRGLYYRHVVQRPMTPGLQWFIRFYGRLSPGRRPIGVPLQLRAAAALAGQGQGLCSLEVRTSPATASSELWQLLKKMDRGLERKDLGSPPELGLVLHFTRDRGGQALQGSPTVDWRWSHADPGTRFGKSPAGNPSGYRYACFYWNKRNEALTFAWVLRHLPTSLELLRGIDVCTDELGVPNWVLMPLFAYVRQAGEEASARLRQFGRTVRPLQTSVHVGEDYVHLLSGLRRVEEAVRHFNLREGDRIGHGLALGVEPREWVRRAGRLPVLREERLFDLAWEWSWYGRQGREPSAGRRQTLEREIYRLSEAIFGSPLPPWEVEILVENLTNPHVLRQVRFPNGPVPTALPSDRLQLVCRYLTERRVFQEGRIIEWLDPRAEGEVLATLQADLRREVAARGITVEVNPTSNLLVGDLQDLVKHPIWRLRPPRPSNDAVPVSICIGSDDPITFATHLRQEYQLLHDALLLADFSDEEARQWLERTRDSGLEARFTLTRSSSPLDSPRTFSQRRRAWPL